MKVPTYDECAALQVERANPWFSEPWDLNLLILRSGTVGQWDDLAVMAFMDDNGRNLVYAVQCTADAWEGEWTNPTHPDGCCYILDGRYPGGYALGEHKGRPALRQQKPFDYVRWPKGRTVPSVADLDALAAEGAHFSDICGTHLHNRASGRSPAQPRTDDSEGCVVSLHYHEHAGLIELVRQQGRFAGSLSVSPTFITLEA